MSSWLKAEFEAEKPRSMVDQLVQSGKQLYLLDAVFVTENWDGVKTYLYWDGCF